MLSGRLLLLSVLVCLMVTLVQEAQGQFGGGRALGGLIGAAIIGAAVGSLLSGGRRRGGFGGGFGRRNRRRNRRRRLFGRSAGDEDATEVDDMEATARQLKEEDNFFLMASTADADDCLKLFVCDLSSRLESTLSDFESGLRDDFASSVSEIDPASGAAEFDLASVIGRTQGEPHCRAVYARCKYDYDSVLGVIRDSAARAAAAAEVPKQGF